MAKRIGKYKISKKESAVSLIDGGVATSPVTFGAGQQSTAVAVTATSDGLTTGIIPTGAAYVTVTSGGANNIVLLPPPTVGTVVWIFVGTNGCELRAGSTTGTDASATISIGGNSASGGHESALPANSLSLMVCTSATTWVGIEIASNNAVSAVEVAG
jgi:hypothetical protein